MPRKQRFKPSRKPKNVEAPVGNQQLDDRKDSSGDQQIGQQAPAADVPAREIESEQG